MNRKWGDQWWRYDCKVLRTTSTHCCEMTTIRLKTDSTLHIPPSTEQTTRLHSNLPSPLSSSTRLGWTTTGPRLTTTTKGGTLTVPAPCSREPLTRGPKSTAPATRRKSASSGVGSRSNTVLQASGPAASVSAADEILNIHLVWFIRVSDL